MIETKKVFLAPQFMRKFKCLGAECEDTCCKGWTVFIDKETYQKYRNIHDNELKPMMNKAVTRNRKADSNDKSYAKINMLEEGTCPFLSKNMLCQIQQSHGEGYLSQICATYPRTANMVNGIIELSASLSCPEVVRLALFNPEIMEFDEYDDDFGATLIKLYTLNTEDKLAINRPHKYFWDIRIFIIDLLQNRKYFLWERLVLLGIFMEKFQKLIDENDISNVPQLIQSYNYMIEQGTFQDVLQNIPAQNDIQLRLIKGIIDIRIDMGTSNKRYLECYEQFIKGISYSEKGLDEDFLRNYENAYEEYYKPYMEKHEYILENYLVNYVFARLFPFTDGAAFDAYMLLVLHYALIKVHLIGMAEFNKGLNEEVIVKLISSFTKLVDHNQIYLKSIVKGFKEKNFINLPYMTILIRN